MVKLCGPRRPHAGALLTIALSVAACARDSAGARVVTRDSAGVQIVENAPPDSAREHWWGIATRPDVDIGAVEGKESAALFRVVDALRLSDGRIAVANAGSSEVRFFSNTGAPLSVVGKQGGGPGEFQRIAGLVLLPGDSIAVLDGGLRRVSIIAADGSFARTVQGAAGERATVFARRDDGMWLAQSTVANALGGVQQGKVRPDVVVVTLPAEGGQSSDTLGTYPGIERVIRVSERGGAISSVEVITPPFAKSTMLVNAGNNLVVGTQDAPEFRAYSTDGKLLRIVRTGAAPQAVTRAVIDAYMHQRLASVAVDQQRSVRESQEALITAQTVPAHGNIIVDRTRRIWVQDYPGMSEDQRWSIYDADGELIARLRLPGSFTVYDAGKDWVLGKELDELDVEHVRLYSIAH
jgi:hypothetical protein